MTGSTDTGLETVTYDLRIEAQTWDDIAHRVSTIVTKASGLCLNRLEAGIFQIIVSAYNPVVEQVIARCSEGQQRMTEVSGALRKTADNYDQYESATEKSFRSLY